MVDLGVIFFLLVIGLFTKPKENINYILAFTFLLLGYLAFLVYYTGNYKPSLFGYYAINIGIALNMIVLALALVTRLKTLILKSNTINSQLLINLKEKEQLHDDHNKRLEILVKQRTHEYIEKNEELNSFIYRASHDIKGPISSLIGLAKLGQIEKDPAMLNEYFKHVLSSSEKLDKTLTDLLQLSHVNESVLLQDKITLQELADHVLTHRKHIENHKNIKIYTEIENKNINIDQRLVVPIIQNLVENSLKYYDTEKDEPWVKLQLYVNNNELVIKVSDNGLGIQEQFREKIFDKFFRIGLKGSGSGLGLHIVKRCIEKLNGNIELSSKNKIGTNFKIRIPLIEQDTP
jgi:signal transduction histidine kinase